MDKLFNGIKIIFCICFALTTAAVLMLNGYILSLFAAAAIIFFVFRKPLPLFTPLLLLGGILLRIVCLTLLRPPLESDFLLMFQAAQSMLSGDMSFNGSAYFSLWAYQSVFVAWETMWLRLWNNPLCLELINAVQASAAVCLLYRIARRFASESAAQAAALLLTFFPFSLTLHVLLSNQIPSAFFLTLGLWLLVCEDCGKLGFWRFPLCGLALQTGNLLRGEGIIILAAAAAWGVFEIINHKNAVKRVPVGLLTMFAVYFAVNSAANFAVVQSGLNPNGIKNGNMGWKFVTGLNFDTYGTYSADDWALISPTLDEKHQITEKTKALQNKLIKERLSAGPAKLTKHIIKKIDRQWNADALSWAFRYIANTPPRIHRPQSLLPTRLYGSLTEGCSFFPSQWRCLD